MAYIAAVEKEWFTTVWGVFLPCSEGAVKASRCQFGLRVWAFVHGHGWLPVLK